MDFYKIAIIFVLSLAIIKLIKNIYNIENFVIELNNKTKYSKNIIKENQPINKFPILRL